MIDYENITAEEIRREVRSAKNPLRQCRILADLSGKPVSYIRQCAGMQNGKGADKPKAPPKADVRRGWTEEDIAYLIEHPNVPTKVLCQVVGKTEATVVSMRHKLGIRRDKIWSDDMVALLIDGYRSGRTIIDIAKAVDKSTTSVYSKIHSLKKTGII